MALNLTHFKNLLSAVGNDHVPPTYILSVRLALLVLLFLTTVFGNGSILALLKRFRSLRTIPNILIANLAAIDLLNVIINLPSIVLVAVFELNHLVKGRLISALVASAQSAFMFLNLFCMAMMMLDRFFAIAFGLRYKVGLSTRKAVLVVTGVWLVTLAIMIPWFLHLYSVDLGDAPTLIYRMVYYYKIGTYVTATRSVFAFLYAVLGLMTWYSLRKQSRCLEREMSLKEDQHGLKLKEAHRKEEARAAITVSITVGAYALSCLPLVVYGIITENVTNLASSESLKWIGFIANYCQFISSACNPFIYMSRCNRYNRALKKFWKDPCGVSDVNSNAINPPLTQTANAINSTVPARSSLCTETSCSEDMSRSVMPDLGDKEDLSPTLSLSAYYRKRKRIRTEVNGTTIRNAASFNDDICSAVWSAHADDVTLSVESSLGKRFCSLHAKPDRKASKKVDCKHYDLNRGYTSDGDTNTVDDNNHWSAEGRGCSNKVTPCKKTLQLEEDADNNTSAEKYNNVGTINVALEDDRGGGADDVLRAEEISLSFDDDDDEFNNADVCRGGYDINNHDVSGAPVNADCSCSNNNDAIDS